MTRTLSFIAALTFAAATAQAEDVALTQEIQAGSLHDGGVDMVIYYVEQADHFEVVATYAPQSAPADAARLRMGLRDGDSTSFALPGLTGVSYSFHRAGGTVHVSSTITQPHTANGS